MYEYVVDRITAVNISSGNQYLVYPDTLIVLELLRLALLCALGINISVAL